MNFFANKNVKNPLANQAQTKTSQSLYHAHYQQQTKNTNAQLASVHDHKNFQIHQSKKYPFFLQNKQNG